MSARRERAIKTLNAGRAYNTVRARAQKLPNRILADRRALLMPDEAESYLVFRFNKTGRVILPTVGKDRLRNWKLTVPSRL